MDTHAKFIELLHDFDTAMLVTHDEAAGLDARPMAVAQVDDQGNHWFVTDRNSGKVAEIRHDAHAALTYQSSNKFLTLSGNARVVDDAAMVKRLWSDGWKVWFPKGPTDPSIILIRFIPNRGQYWDNSGVNGLRYLFKAGKAYVEGERISRDDSTNASVNL